MPRFFVPDSQITADGRTVVIRGDDAWHMERSLRMAVGDRVTVCDGAAHEYECVLERFTETGVYATVVDKHTLTTEPPFRVTWFQALPKGDKLDTVIQKAVECGVTDIYPFESAFCVARDKADARERKQERRIRIAEEAAKQSGRGRVPDVFPTVSFAQALTLATQADIPLFCYEGEGTESLKTLLRTKLSGTSAGPPHIAVMVGSEGGFSAEEAARARAAGMLMAGLGKRILRTETVAPFVLGCLVYEMEL